MIVFVGSGRGPQSGRPSRLQKEISMKAWMSGNVAGTGTFRCTECDFPVSLDAADELPPCPSCGGTAVLRASLFTTAQNAIVEALPEVEDHAWLGELRAGLD